MQAGLEANGALPVLGAFQSRPDGGAQARGGPGCLADVVVQPRLHRFHRQLFVPGAGKHDDRDARVPGLDRTQDRQAVGPAQVGVGDHQVEIAALERGGEGLLFGDLPDVEVEVLQAELAHDERAIVRIVVDNQDAQSSTDGITCAG